ncbi:histamine H2 receptor-like [Stylophora pistillata]|uniref:histamine H2 receptor-like n=1 Tax=Stylophora pistillata TaxID=50429 RepID=UPI000C04285A|nr:histamine H2 receptor-like [Stylophora pistillata]
MADLPSRSVALTIVESGFMIALNILSLGGNIMVCTAVYRSIRLRTTTNIYIIALAISDLLSAIFIMPFAAGVLISGRWPFGKVFCQINAFFSLFVVYVSPVTMGLTAVNRYMRICKSDVEYKRFFSPRKSRLVLAFVWGFIACYILGLRLAGLQGFHFVPEYASCLNQHLIASSKIVHYFVVVGLFFLLPLAVTIFSYRKVSRKIKEHNISLAMTHQSQRRDANVSVHEIRVSRSLFVVVFAFMLCWIPAWAITILTRFVGKVPRNVQLLCAYFVNFSSTINPFIYTGMNPLFRRDFTRILRCAHYNKIGNESGSNTQNNQQGSSQKTVALAQSTTKQHTM